MSHFLLPWRLFHLLVLVFSMVANAETGSIAVGINFGPTSITAAYITESGKAMPIFSVIGSNEYRSYVADSQKYEGVKIQHQGQWYIQDGESLIPTSEDPETNPKADALFAKTLLNIKAEITKSLKERPFRITSIGIPHHFNGSSSGPIFKAALNQEEGIIRPWQLYRYFHAVRLAYNLNFCEGYGLDNSCDMEDSYLILFIDYNQGYLELLLAEVEDFMFAPVGSSIRLENLGSGRLEGATWNTDHHRDKIRNAIQRLVENHFHRKDHPKNLEHLHAIVISGEAPNSAFKDIKDAVLEVLPGHEAQIRDSIDPHFVGAIGAAQWARLQLHKPELLKDLQTVEFEDSHDEL